MSTVKVKKRDVGIVLSALLTSDGIPVDLSDATVEFFMRKGSTVISGTADVIIGVVGRVAYTTEPDELAVAGTYKQEWKVTFGDGRIYTYPSKGYNKVVVVADLNS